MNEPPLKRRTTTENLYMIGFNSIPLLFVYALGKFKSLRNLMAYPINLLMFVAAWWVGRRLWLYLTENEFSVTASTNEGEMESVKWKDRRWGSAIASTLVGFAVYAFLRLLATHGMARAIDAAFADE
jgi:hypothetical protein